MSGNIAKFQTLEEQIESTILRNLEASDGKERSYFDVMRNVVPEYHVYGTRVLDRLISEGVVVIKHKTSFLHNRPVNVTMYRCNIPLLREMV